MSTNSLDASAPAAGEDFDEAELLADRGVGRD